MGARTLEVGIWGAYQNVLINLEAISDQAYCECTKVEASAIHARAEAAVKTILQTLDQRSAVKLS